MKPAIRRLQSVVMSKREAMKQEAWKEAMRLLEALPEAVQNLKELFQGMKDIPNKDYKNRELDYKASLKTLEVAGIRRLVHGY
jgi:hypothetical protein